MSGGGGKDVTTLLLDWGKGDAGALNQLAPLAVGTRRAPRRAVCARSGPRCPPSLLGCLTLEADRICDRWTRVQPCFPAAKKGTKQVV